jgi:hypothetical protein
MPDKIANLSLSRLLGTVKITVCPIRRYKCVPPHEVSSAGPELAEDQISIAKVTIKKV